MENEIFKAIISEIEQKMPYVFAWELSYQSPNTSTVDLQLKTRRIDDVYVCSMRLCGTQLTLYSYGDSNTNFDIANPDFNIDKLIKAIKHEAFKARFRGKYEALLRIWIKINEFICEVLNLDGK